MAELVRHKDQLLAREIAIFVLIADDHLLIRNGLKYLLNEEYRNIVFGEASNAQETYSLIVRQRWNLILLDLRLFDKAAFDLLQNALNLHFAAPVLVLGSGESQAVRARKLRAAGFVDKRARRSELTKAIKLVLAGKQYLGELCHADPAHPTALDDQLQLSPRELAVLEALGAGRRTSEIALELKLNTKTVSTYKRRIFKKLGFKSNADLIRYVIEHQSE